jgi:hypothetical protein
MRKAGIDRNVLNAILGHEAQDLENSNYDIVDDSDLIKAIDKLEVFFTIVDQIVDHREVDKKVDNV